MEKDTMYWLISSFSHFYRILKKNGKTVTELK